MAKQRVPRTRNMGTQTEAQYWGGIRSALRQHFKWWKPAGEAKRRARVGPNKYKCAECDGLFPSKEVEKDHVVPCGPLKSYEDVGGWLERISCEDVEDGWQMLCKPCHLIKSKAERAARKEANEARPS